MNAPIMFSPDFNLVAFITNPAYAWLTIYMVLGSFGVLVAGVVVFTVWITGGLTGRR